MGNRLIFYCFFTLGLMSSCAKVPYEELDQIPTSSLSTSLDQALQTEVFTEGDWPNETWWDFFSDPQLTSLIEEGLQNSPNLKKIEARVRESLNIATQIKSKLFPHLRFDGSDNYQHLSKSGFERAFAFHAPPLGQTPPALQDVDFAIFAKPVPAVLNTIDLGFGLNWELDFFGKNRLRLAAALGDVKAREAEAKQARLVLSSEIAQTYFSLQTHWAILEIHRELVTLKKREDSLANQRADIGLDTKLTSIAAKIDLSIAAELVYRLEETVALDQHRLYVLMGQAPDVNRSFKRAFHIFKSPFPLPREISSNLLARRPDLMAAIWRVEQAAAQVGVAKREFYPEVNLSGLLGLRSVLPDQFFNVSNAVTSLLPSFTLPIFEAGKLRANLKEKMAHYDETLQSYHEVLLHALQEIADLLTQFSSVAKQVGAQKTAWEGALAREVLERSKFEVGLSNAISLLDLEWAALNEKSTYLTFQSNQILFAIKLMQALGGGYESSNMPGINEN